MNTLISNIQHATNQLKTVQWAKSKGFYDTTTAELQAGKLEEEFMELRQGLLDDDIAEIADGLGDSLITLYIRMALTDTVMDGEVYHDGHHIPILILIPRILNPNTEFLALWFNKTVRELHNIARIHDLDLQHCFDTELAKISKRKGTVVDGVFVKDGE